MTEDPDHQNHRTVGGLETVRYVGPATAAALAAAGIDAGDLREKRVSYRQVVEAGVNPGVAAKLRREHSLSWTLAGGDPDLGTRSEVVRGLRDGERRWVARSDDPDWTAGSDGPHDPPTRERPHDQGYGATIDLVETPRTLEPTTAITGLDDAAAAALAEAGINTVHRLATVDPVEVAAAIGEPLARLRTWRDRARSRRQTSR